MNRSLKIALSSIAWAAIAAYLVWAGGLGERKRAAVSVHEMRISVRDSAEIGIIRPADVRRWINAAGLDPVGKHIDSIDLMAITQTVGSHDFVRTAKTSVGLDGVLTVTMDQRRPVVRIMTDNEYDFYYTADGYIVPAGRHSAHYVPVVTGHFGLPFANGFSGQLGAGMEETEKKSNESYVFLYKLINFVEYIEDNEFWNAQVVQINVLPPPNARTQPEIELIPRVGDHVILLGWLDGYERKLDKLLAFYRKAMPKEGKVVVQGINLVKRHTKPSQTTPGGIVTKEAPIHVSNVAIVASDGKATKIRKRTEEKSASLAGPVK